ncbi:hypothetical protein [Lysinibacillus sp. SGAir0095]|uniref:hypothetical protein n=1 Tax=Lysinibacillus sp. SGAir0095 TaxID=2070463 RepID=UPI0010CD50D0|nr:hypothetical protein [Lysinibacillus sp. SGAir0095]QCR33121.1 hypothetical protein C1N55_13435 [Lysinibacillus sp. SGAir0095]
MQIQEAIVINVDIKNPTIINQPQVTQNDSNAFLVNIFDGGKPLNLDGVANITIAHTRYDRKVIVTGGTKVGTNQVKFIVDRPETSVTGQVDAVVQLYNAESRISTLTFSYRVIADPTNNYTPSDSEKTLIEVVLNDGPLRIQEAIEAGEYATDQGDYAKAQGEYATGQANYATEQGDYAKSQGDTVKGSVDTMNARLDNLVTNTGNSTTEIVDARLGADNVARQNVGALVREIHGQQLDSARQTTTLAQGTSVVNASSNALANVEIEGRTLTSLGNSNLQSGKKYVLADNKTKMIAKGSMGEVVTGVAKFTNNYLTTTANFEGKVSGSAVANPHVLKGSDNSSGNTSLLIPSSTSFFESGNYASATKLDGTLYTTSRSASGVIAQQLFSFNIIEQVERTLGRIPKDTVADKVQWLKDNVKQLTANWHGFGSSVGGNKANLRVSWSDNSWAGTTNHTSTTVSKLSMSFTDLTAILKNDAFVHFLAYAEPSDGVTASTINTDYIDLVVELKDTAQLDTRPTIIRVENFEGKVSGSTVENPHVAKHASPNLLQSPSGGGWGEFVAHYGFVSNLDGGNYASRASSVNGEIAQTLFSFNLIETVERNIGKIPKSTIADKVQWLKDNLAKLTCNWHGFGSSVGGNRGSLSVWSKSNSSWVFVNALMVSVVSKLTYQNISPSSTSIFDTDGVIHFLAHAEPSDGTTASKINTDYVELEIQLKPTANFTAPKVPLYEVPDDEYNKILVDWNADEVKKRYPVVESTQHLQGVAVTSEGENLLPPFTEWTIHANAKVISPYELEHKPTATGQFNDVTIKASPNTPYAFNIPSGQYGISYFDNKGVEISFSGWKSGIFTFSTPSNTESIRVRLSYLSGDVGRTISFIQPILTLGSTAKPFVPRNPSYLFADVKLGAIGTVKDVLFADNGRWKVRKAVEKDIVLDGSLAWGVFNGDTAKYLYVSNFINSTATLAKEVTNYNGLKLKPYSGYSTATPEDMIRQDIAITVGITVGSKDSGWSNTFVPTDDQMKAYFNGWKYTGDGTTHSWISIVDGTAPSTNTIDYVKANKAPSYTPYKLSYILATPQITDVTDKVEGDVKLNGLTQVNVDSGVIVREKVTPVINTAGTYYDINVTTQPTSLLKNKVLRFISIYKNGIIDTPNWTIASTSNQYGNYRAWIDKSKFDSTAEYTVTYLALEKPLLTTNPLSVKLSYANSIRSALNDTMTKVEDNTTMLSVHEKAIVELYVRVKALEAK